MSMEFSNNYSNYAKSGTSTAKEGNVTTSTVEIENINRGNKDGADQDGVQQYQ